MFRRKKRGESFREKRKYGETLSMRDLRVLKSVGGIEGKEEDGAGVEVWPQAEEERQEGAETEPEKKKPRKKSLRLWRHFIFNHFFASVNLKILFCREAILDS